MKEVIVYELEIVDSFVKVDRFLISPKINNIKIDDKKIMNPEFLLGIDFNIPY